MVVHDFNVHGIAIHPNKADSPPIVDPDAMLSAAAALQCFERTPFQIFSVSLERKFLIMTQL
jgi:hypothetical protein